MYLLRLADAEGQRFDIVGSSPEALVTVRDGHATTHPIAGTGARGHRGGDLLLEKDLRSDEKERAEHVMLVDLGATTWVGSASPARSRCTTSSRSSATRT